MRRALTQLGYVETYHGFAPAFETPRDSEMWLDAVNAKFKGKGKPFGRHEWDQLLGHCQAGPLNHPVFVNRGHLTFTQAVTDCPAMGFGPELIEAYPEAKVILTLRDVDSWYKYEEPKGAMCLGLTNFLPGRLWKLQWSHSTRSRGVSIHSLCG